MWNTVNYSNTNNSGNYITYIHFIHCIVLTVIKRKNCSYFSATYLKCFAVVVTLLPVMFTRVMLLKYCKEKMLTSTCCIDSVICTHTVRISIKPYAYMRCCFLRTEHAFCVFCFVCEDSVMCLKLRMKQVILAFCTKSKAMFKYCSIWMCDTLNKH